MNYYCRHIINADSGINYELAIFAQLVKTITQFILAHGYKLLFSTLNYKALPRTVTITAPN